MMVTVSNCSISLAIKADKRRSRRQSRLKNDSLFVRQRAHNRIARLSTRFVDAAFFDHDFDYYKASIGGD
jgi:hypothetical protein